MKRLFCSVVFVFALALCISGCGRKAKIIPASTLTDIYMDIFMADYWVNDHYVSRRIADTARLYEPIFRKYGYTTLDYRASVNHYLDKPDKYAKILSRAADNLDMQRERLEEIERIVAARPKYGPYVRHTYNIGDITGDSKLIWHGQKYIAPVDSSVLDSVVVDSLGLDSLATDSALVDSVLVDSAAVDSVLVDSVLLDTVFKKEYVREKDSVVVLRSDGLDEFAPGRHPSKDKRFRRESKPAGE